MAWRRTNVGRIHWRWVLKGFNIRTDDLTVEYLDRCIYAYRNFSRNASISVTSHWCERVTSRGVPFTKVHSAESFSMSWRHHEKLLTTAKNLKPTPLPDRQIIKEGRLPLADQHLSPSNHLIQLPHHVFSQDVGVCFKIKVVFCKYWDSYHAGKMVMRPAYFHDWNSFIAKWTLFYWDCFSRDLQII